MGDVRGGERQGDLGGEGSLSSALGSTLNTGAGGRLKLCGKSHKMALRL